MEKIYQDKIMSFSPIERFYMAFDMLDTAKALALASLPKDLSKEEVRVQMFLRFYGNDFSEIEKEKIISHLRNIK
ncbi:MAG TPA: hypothetical protein PK079_25415 [Leptospiraceae bacterium]|nr:hypothetical protein [Leptospiraceae bacterium]HMX31198.1 hypothetical protein [Leptospiraceae bacterium]HMY29404.1 hypothetical protein [Leptospiraceae bacterium]HMZ66604.1 hypothetical protein [Leptospiraceae bacterium]HNA06408.1 hypothetical protein [Leptospiraceae bacterium]